VTSYNDFFAGSATIAGALVGLLFVSLSIQPERNRRYSIEHRAVAGTAFTALVDALFTSLIGLQPGAGLQYGAVIFGVIGLIASSSLAFRLWSARRDVQLSRRWLSFMLFIIVVYVAQLAVGLTPHMSNASAASNTATFIYIMFGIGIARAWELLGMQGGGMVKRLAGSLTHFDPQSPPDPPGTPDSSGTPGSSSSPAPSGPPAPGDPGEPPARY
jgi:energy-converting hydrogenase Eha subunit A